MNSREINLSNSKFNIGEFEKTSSKMPLNEVFSDPHQICLNGLNLFVAHFNSIPNLIFEREIDCIKANQWFTETNKDEIKDTHFLKRYNTRTKKCEFDTIAYLLFDDLIVYFDINYSVVYYLFRKTEMKKVDDIINKLNKFRKREKKSKVSLLISTMGVIETKPFEISKPKLNIKDNYNDDFKEIHQTILKSLTKMNHKGLVLLHGKPGTGKTSYIRYLITLLNKNIIFLPPNMAEAITSPDFISILIENPNSIFVIEDAENIIIDREKGEKSTVSTLLNISDGLLSDCLNIQIICTFNTDLSKIDNALMRRGRLIAKYEFKELETIKANELSRKLGFTRIFNSPTSLSSIYNQQEKEFHQNKKINTIGFRAIN